MRRSWHVLGRGGRYVCRDVAGGYFLDNFPGNVAFFFSREEAVKCAIDNKEDWNVYVCSGLEVSSPDAIIRGGVPYVPEHFDIGQ